MTLRLMIIFIDIVLRRFVEKGYNVNLPDGGVHGENLMAHKFLGKAKKDGDLLRNNKKLDGSGFMYSVRYR